MQNKIFIYCDGGARGNPGPAASAFVIYDNNHNLIHEDGSFIGKATNNQAEYQAVINALNWLSINHRNSNIVFYLDSLLIVNHLKKLYKVKDLILKQKYHEIDVIIGRALYKIVDYVFIPREQNSRADFLVNRTLDKTEYSKKQ